MSEHWCDCRETGRECNVAPLQKTQSLFEVSNAANMKGIKVSSILIFNKLLSRKILVFE